MSIKAKRGDKLYKVGPQFDIVTYIYLQRKDKDHHVLMDASTMYEHTMSNQMFNQLSLSKVMLLGEVEKVLIDKLKIIHQEMKVHRVTFNPLYNKSDRVQEIVNRFTEELVEIVQFDS